MSKGKWCHTLLSYFILVHHRREWSHRIIILLYTTALTILLEFVMNKGSEKKMKFLVRIYMTSFLLLLIILIFMKNYFHKLIQQIVVYIWHTIMGQGQWYMQVYFFHWISIIVQFGVLENLAWKMKGQNLGCYREKGRTCFKWHNWMSL